MDFNVESNKINVGLILSTDYIIFIVLFLKLILFCG